MDWWSHLVFGNGDVWTSWWHKSVASSENFMNSLPLSSPVHKYQSRHTTCQSQNRLHHDTLWNLRICWKALHLPPVLLTPFAWITAESDFKSQVSHPSSWVKGAFMYPVYRQHPVLSSSKASIFNTPFFKQPYWSTGRCFYLNGTIWHVLIQMYTCEIINTIMNPSPLKASVGLLVISFSCLL